MQQKFSATASAPGKLMLFGEHAVLHGHLAIVCAMNKRIRVRAQRLDDMQLQVVSELGEIEYPIKNIPQQPKLAFVCEAVREFTNELNCGLLLNIESDIPANIGLGSSAATTAATVAAIAKLLSKQLEPIEIFTIAKQALMRAQASGSGADLAASVFGGTIAYRTEPFACSKLPNNPKLAVIYSGSKLATADVIKKVANQHEQDPKKYNTIFKKIGNISRDAIVAINNSDWNIVGKLADQQQQLMQKMNLENTAITAALCALKTPGISGAKISGAGLGDCVIGIKNTDHNIEFCLDKPLTKFDLSVEAIGIKYES